MRSFALPLLIFMLVTSAQQQSVQIPHTEFHPNWTVSVERTDAKTCATLRKVAFTALIFMKLTNSLNLYGNHVFKILSKLLEKCRKYGQHFFFILK